MKYMRMACGLMILALMFCAGAMAETTLTARVEGGALTVSWDAAPSGGTLTLYMDGWPTEALRVQPRGSVQRPALAGHTYAARLRTDNGCLTANAVGDGSAPTAPPAAQPTAAPTPARTPAPTVRPTAAPTPARTLAPTVRPTAAPTVALTPRPTAVPAASNRSDLAAQVVEQVNAERGKAGLGALRVDAELTRAAQVRAGEITQTFSHTRPDGTPWSTVSASAYGENIAMGQRTADKVMAAWMSSQGHRENILRAGYGSIGVCCVVQDGVCYWVQLFGK